MPILSTTKDYTGRKVDINVSGSIDPFNPDAQVPSLKFGLVSTKVAGVEKLLQRYATMLLTPTGSQKNSPTFGTDFLPTLLGGNLIDAGHLTHTFNIASWSVVKSMRSYQAKHPADPLDEQINAASLINFEVVGTTVKFNVKIQTLAGDIISFVLPVSTPD